MLRCRRYLLVASFALLLQASATECFAQGAGVTNSEDVTFSVVSPKDGSLWVATSSRGLLRLGATGRCFSYNSSKGDFACDSISALAFDSEGNLWMKDSEGAVWSYSEIAGFSRREASLPESVAAKFNALTKPIDEVAPQAPAPSVKEMASLSASGLGLGWCIVLFVIAAVLGFILARFLIRPAKAPVFHRNPEIIADNSFSEQISSPAIVSEAEKPAAKALLKVKDGPSAPLESDFCAKVLEIVVKRFSDPEFSVEDIASVFGITRVHLTRKLKAEGAPSPGEMIKKARMDAAAAMISSGETNMSSVAKTCGFSSPAYFSSAFKEYFGVAPRSYKS